MDELFDGAPKSRARPLADRMRPQTLDDIIGQDHIVGEGRLLRRSIQADRLSSLIFYGPPGTGKTSLARVIANTTKAGFESLNAVLSGIKDIREAIDRSGERQKLYGKRTILFVDEVHRWNKAQQDALLPWVENGTVILVGATTENPFFEVNRALVSRSRVFQLKALTQDDLFKTARKALADVERGYGAWRIEFESGALEHLVEVASGDARSLLNALELAVETTCQPWPPEKGSSLAVTLKAAEESIQRRAVLYDRDGDYHFDTISAFIKSVRGSDPDASLYWLAKMVRAGEDPSFIFRRMIILASEDVGMADPYALQVVISCAEAFDRIGFPEGNYPLAHACIYLATAPKSNSAMAFFDALALVDKEDAETPNHLRDASRDKESFGHGEGYVYPHAYREHWTAQQYLPSSLQGKLFYAPSTVGYEQKIREGVMQKRELQAAALLDESAGHSQAAAADSEFLSWSPQSKGREAWFKRLESGRNGLLLRSRDEIFLSAAPKRHDRLLVLAAADGLLLWEGLRRAPEGLCAALVENDEQKKALEQFALSMFDEIELPKIAVMPSAGLGAVSRANMPPSPAEAQALFSCASFDKILAREPFRQIDKTANPADFFREFAEKARMLLAKSNAKDDSASIVLLASPPELGEKLSRIIEKECSASNEFNKKFNAVCEDFFTDDNAGKKGARQAPWNEQTIQTAFSAAGLQTEIKIIDQKEERLILEKDIQAWFDSEKSSWGSYVHKRLGQEDFIRAKTLLQERAQKGPILWTWKSLLIHGFAKPV
jgi:putative ATPase